MEEPQLCSKCGKPLTELEGWVITTGGLVCKECDFKTVRPFKPVKCPNCGREIDRLSNALTGRYLGFEERWEVLCKCYTWVEE